MITLNLNEDKKLKFSYGVANVHAEDIKGSFILDFGDSFVGFPIKIYDGKIVAEVKSLNKYLKESQGIVKARLEIIASDTFIIPWDGEVKINGPVKMTVKEEIPTKSVKKVEKVDTLEKYVKQYEDFVKEEKPIKSVYEDEDHLKKLISLDKDIIVEKVKEEVKDVEEKEENAFSDFLNTPIEELI